MIEQAVKAASIGMDNRQGNEPLIILRMFLRIYFPQEAWYLNMA
jgi:hypothetical protein